MVGPSLPHLAPKNVQEHRRAGRRTNGERKMSEFDLYLAQNVILVESGTENNELRNNSKGSESDRS